MVKRRSAVALSAVSYRRSKSILPASASMAVRLQEDALGFLLDLGLPFTRRRICLITESSVLMVFSLDACLSENSTRCFFLVKGCGLAIFSALAMASSLVSPIAAHLP